MGRPRDIAIDDAILSVAWQELNRVGYAAMTLTAVADGAGVQKPALYRRWPTKQVLAIDALVRHLPPVRPVDTGTLRGDLEHVVADVAKAWQTPAARLTLSPLLADIADDEVVRRRLAQELLNPRGEALRAVLRRAQDRGEIPTDAPTEVVADLLEGPLMHRATLAGASPDDALVQAVLESCLAILRPA